LTEIGLEVSGTCHHQLPHRPARQRPAGLAVGHV